MKKITLKFVKERETKNTVRYQEVQIDDDTPFVVGTLYVKKINAGNAENLTVTIEEAEL